MIKTATKTRPRNPGKATTSRKILPTSKPSKLTMKSQLIRLLSKVSGSDITGISKRFGWQPHTTRAALSGLCKAGYEISSMKSGAGKPSKYRIMSGPEKEVAQ